MRKIIYYISSLKILFFSSFLLIISCVDSPESLSPLGVENVIPVGSASWNIGVREYIFDKSGVNNELKVLHVNETYNASIKFETNEAEVTKVLYHDKNKYLKFSFDQKNNLFCFTDNNDETITFHFNGEKWISDGCDLDEALDVIKNNRMEIMLMAGSVADFKMYEYLQKNNSHKDIGANGGEIRKTAYFCDYTTELKGDAQGLSRTSACWDATNNVNDNCFNSVCNGCCDYQSYDCDCICIPYLGDFLCSCTIIGFPCVEEPIDPPPPLGDGECTGSCYICTTCEYIYDSANGDPENGIIQGTVFSDLPDDWNCPICGASKDSFYEY